MKVAGESCIFLKMWCKVFANRVSKQFRGDDHSVKSVYQDLLQPITPTGDEIILILVMLDVTQGSRVFPGWLFWSVAPVVSVSSADDRPPLLAASPPPSSSV